MSKGHRVPLLLTSHGWESEKQSFYSLSDNRYQTKYIATLEGKRIIGSAYGWLVLTDLGNDDCCLWNPESNEEIQLPSLHATWTYFDCCVLSKPPTEPDCVAVFKAFTNVEQCVCRISDGEFVKLSFREGGYWFRSLVAICSFQEEIYGIVKLDALYEFVTIHLVGKTVETKPLLINGEPHLEVPKLWSSWISLFHHYLIELPGGTGEFFLVIKMVSGCYIGGGVDFSVFRVDVNGLVCVELENLDGLTIFIGTCGNGFCCHSCGMGIKPNSIYYTGHNGKVMCVYDLDDRSTTPLLPCPVAGATCRLTIGSTSPESPVRYNYILIYMLCRGEFLFCVSFGRLVIIGMN